MSKTTTLEDQTGLEGGQIHDPIQVDLFDISRSKSLSVMVTHTRTAEIRATALSGIVFAESRSLVVTKTGD